MCRYYVLQARSSLFPGTAVAHESLARGKRRGFWVYPRRIATGWFRGAAASCGGSASRSLITLEALQLCCVDKLSGLQ